MENVSNYQIFLDYLGRYGIMKKCCFKEGVNMSTKMLTKEQINLIVSYVSTRANQEDNYLNKDDENIFSIDTKINKQLDDYKQINVRCVAIGDRGIMPISEDDHFDRNKEFTDMMNICNSYTKPEIKVKSLKRKFC